MRCKTMFILVVMLAVGFSLQNCSESVTDSPLSSTLDDSFAKIGVQKLKTTGGVEIAWMGGNGKNAPDMEKRAFADFNAHKELDSEEVKGEFIYRVMSPDLLVVHREIIAKVDKYWQTDNQAWFSAIVINDSKGCGTGNGSGGHSDGCSDDASGGCSGDDASHDDGCDDTDSDHTDGGCGEDHTDGTDHTDGCGGSDMGGSSGGESGGGCGEDHADGTDHTDGGCGEDHTDGTDHTDGGCGGDDTGGSPGGPSGDKGSPTKGKNCRVGQLIYVKAYDFGTPATDGDVVGWKWFSSAEGAKRPKDGHQTEWKLCPKTILGGNLVVHN